jgi:cell division protein FtsQ
MSRPARPSRLIPQQPTRKKKTLLRRGQPRNTLRRRRVNLQLWPQILWFTLGVAGLAGVSVGLLLLYYHLLTSPLFCIKDIDNIEVIGNQRFTRAQILEMAHLDNRTNLLALKPSLVEQTLLSHPWIATAELERRWPNRLTLRFTERVPLAMVQLEELYYIDRSGSLFKPSSPLDPHDFPVITGLSREYFADGPSPASNLLNQTLGLVEMLQEAPPPLEIKHIAEIHVDPERGFTLCLSRFKIALDFGFTDLPEKIKKLQAVWPFLSQHGYLAQAGRINLDHPQRLFLTLKETGPTN